MRTHWGEPPTGNPGRAILLEQFREHAAAELAKHPRYRSLILSVAQYWADEAADAVHAWLVYSARDVPVWPHVCEPGRHPPFDEEEMRFGTDRCSTCGPDFAWWRDLDENGSAIPQLEACCHEGAGQDEEYKRSYLPYALARRTEAGVTVEIIGGPVRAWLDPRGDAPTPSTPHDPVTAALVALVHAAPADDAARQVLADHLLEQGDPRGTYLTARDPALRRELEARHARTWLGPLADVAPPEHVVMEHSFPRAIAVHAPEPTDALREAPEWGSIEELWFLPESAVFFTPRMRALRAVGPVGRAGLRELEAHASVLALASLHVCLDTDGLAALARLALPALRRLAVETPDALPASLAPLETARFWRSLEELVLMSTDPAVVRAWTGRPVGERPPRLTFAAPSPTRAPAGWELSVVGPDATIRIARLGLGPMLEDVVAMLDALPGHVHTVRIEPTRWFVPEADDRAALEAALGRRRTVV